jgi:hypothetical protein
MPSMVSIPTNAEHYLGAFLGCVLLISLWHHLTFVAACSFTGAGLRTMRCLLGTMQENAPKKITVEAIADGANFVGKTIQQERLLNTAKLTCANSPTATAQDPTCNKQSTANITVSKGAVKCSGCIACRSCSSQRF